MLTELILYIQRCQHILSLNPLLCLILFFQTDIYSETSPEKNL